MTPASIRRLGELARINPDSGEMIPLERVDVDHRVMQISCLALVERTIGKAREYDPASEKPTTPEFNPRAYSPEQLDVIERTLHLLVNPPTPAEPEVIPPAATGSIGDLHRAQPRGRTSPGSTLPVGSARCASAWLTWLRTLFGAPIAAKRTR
jgi:hypothetical protein